MPSLTYPERVKRLLLWGTTPCLSLGDQPEWMSKRAGSVQAQEDLKRVPEDGSLTPQERHRAFLRILVPIVHFHNPAIAASTLVPLIDQMTISVEPYSYWQANEKQAYDIRGDLGRIIAPTQVLAGSDEMPPIEVGSRFLAEQIPKAKPTFIEQCGHWPMFECPDRFFDAVSDFLENAHCT